MNAEKCGRFHFRWCLRSKTHADDENLNETFIDYFQYMSLNTFRDASVTTMRFSFETFFSSFQFHFFTFSVKQINGNVNESGFNKQSGVK